MLVIKVIRAKLHGIRITQADRDYHGSVTLDPEHCDVADIRRFEFVDIWNKNSGARINTYVIFGEAGSRCCTLNGAAARTCQIGDEVVIAASEYIDPVQLCEFDTMVLIFNADNSIRDRLKYRVRRTPSQKFLSIRMEASGSQEDLPLHPAQLNGAEPVQPRFLDRADAAPNQAKPSQARQIRPGCRAAARPPSSPSSHPNFVSDPTQPDNTGK